MDLDDVLTLIEEKNFKTVERCKDDILLYMSYDVKTKNGGVIRFTHNVITFTQKEVIEINLLVPKEAYSIKTFRIRSDSADYYRVQNAFQIVRGFVNNDYKQYF